MISCGGDYGIQILKSIAFAGTLLAVCNVFGGDKTVVALNPLSATGDLAAERELISDIMQATLSDSTTVTIVDRKICPVHSKNCSLGHKGDRFLIRKNLAG
jgi:hypothetical protein